MGIEINENNEELGCEHWKVWKVKRSKIRYLIVSLRLRIHLNLQHYLLKFGA